MTDLTAADPLPSAPPPPPPRACPPRVAGIARTAEIVAAAGMVLLTAGALLMIALALFAPEEAAALIRDEIGRVASEVALDGGVVVLVMVLGHATTATGLYGLDCVRRLFRGYRRGEIFAPVAAARLRGLGWTVLALAPVSIISDMLAVLAATWGNPPGARSVAIDIADTDVYAVAIGLTLVAVGRVTEEAARIAAENEEFI